MTGYSFPRFRVCLSVLAMVCVSGGVLAQVASNSAPNSALANSNPAAVAVHGVLKGETQNPRIPAAPTPQSKRNQAAQQLQLQERQRIFGIVPYFNISNVQDAAPLSPRQKFQLMFHSTTDPFEFIAIGAVAGLGQATDSHSGYGQGAEGFGKRYGAAYADSVDGALWGNAIFPSLLHQDPRYFRRGTGTFSRRFLYSLSTAVWSKNDSGKWGPNYSNVMGNLVAGGVSNLYYPSEDRGIGLTFEGAAIVTGEGALGSLFWEFWPDVAHKLFHTSLPELFAPATK